MPATSSKVTFSCESVMSRALLFPNERAFPPPTCIWRMKKIHTPISRSMGTHERKTWNHEESSFGFAVIFTPLLRNREIISGSFGAYVLKGPLDEMPEILSPWMVTCVTLPLSTIPRKSL